MKTLLLVVVVLVATAAAARVMTHSKNAWKERESGWGYGDSNGPDTWPDTYPACGGSRQSPVSLVFHEALTGFKWEPLRTKNYGLVPSLPMKISNTGHSVQVNLDNDATVAGSNLTGVYAFSQFHFHWGSVDTRGSEHTVDRNRFPAELHLVHYKMSYGSMEEALQHNDGVAVLSVLLELSEEDNLHLEPIVNSLAEVTKPHDVTYSKNPIALQDILPEDVQEFFRYEGSLTTPACNEVVIWTVFSETIPISHKQLKQFRQLVGNDGNPLQDNFRTLQPLNGRKGSASWRPREICTACSDHCTSESRGRGFCALLRGFMVDRPSVKGLGVLLNRDPGQMPSLHPCFSPLPPSPKSYNIYWDPENMPSINIINLYHISIKIPYLNISKRTPFIYTPPAVVHS